MIAACCRMTCSMRLIGLHPCEGKTDEPSLPPASRICPSARQFVRVGRLGTGFLTFQR
jgi:hypothetical protein